MTDIERCTRCQREAPHHEDPEYVRWEMDFDPGSTSEEAFALICPGCLTFAERQAIKEGIEEGQEKMERQLRESARRRAEQRRAAQRRAEGLE